jgi:uncharacterized paraquat-inducible protein A
MTGEETDRLLLRSEYVTRCAWCGTPHSPQWVGKQYGGEVFCSSECQLAAASGDDRALGAIILVICTVLVLLPLSGVLSISGIMAPSATLSLVLGMMLLPAGICLFTKGMLGQKYVDRKNLYRNTQLLLCEYCNHINEPGVSACTNCGATLVDAQFVTDPWPKWFDPPPRVREKKRFGPCEHCGASFAFPVLSADGQDRCPRCGKVVY